MRISGRTVVVLAWLLTLPLVTPKIRGADEIEYFAYLRSMAFDRDLEFGNEYRHFYERDPQGLAGFAATFLDRREPQTGRHINFAPLGSALLWSPFYLLAHLGVLLARAAGSAVPADGFAAPYVAAACYASWLYGGLGLLVIHDALRRFGGARRRGRGMGHRRAALGEPAPVLHDDRPRLLPRHLRLCRRRAGVDDARRARAAGGLTRWIAVGALGGIAALVREQDALFLAVPLGLLVADAARTGKWGAAALRAAVTVATAVSVFVPQLLAYRAINGAFGPSRLVTRKMTYTSPHFLEVLLDPGHGLFVWAPVLLVAVDRPGRDRDPPARRGGRRPAAGPAPAGLDQRLGGELDAGGRFRLPPVRGSDGGVRLGSGGGGGRAARARGAGGLRRGPRRSLAWWNVSLMVQFGLRLMDRQRLEWPRVAINQVTEVPPRAARAAWLFLTDRERLVRETR